MKNGVYFLTILNSNERTISLWDPHLYREKGQGQPLSFYADVKKISKRKKREKCLVSGPIEYKNIAGAGNLTFDLAFSEKENTNASNVEEQDILFGTMRAYLGNVLVIPKDEWLGYKNSPSYVIKSEFVRVKPKDNFPYFWWLYLQSPKFLRLLPMGTGGTRPRLNAEALSDIVIDVPKESARKQIHEELLTKAETAWQNQHQMETLMRKHGLI